MRWDWRFIAHVDDVTKHADDVTPAFERYCA
jgi:hypothetical protein